MKLNITMYKDSVTRFEDCIRDATTAEQIGDGNIGGGTPYRVYFIRQETTPQWFDFIRQHVQPNKLQSTTNTLPGVVVLLQVQTPAGSRFFGITHGSGHALVDRDRIELDFGLKTAMSAADPAKLTLSDSRNVGGRARQKRVASSYEATLGGLEFDFDTDIPRLIGGQCNSTSLGNRIDGSDSLHVTVRKKDISFDGLAKKCRDLFDIYKSDAYKQHFEFIEIASERDKVTIDRLEAQLITAINTEQNNGEIAMVCPDQIDQWECTSYRISGMGSVETAEPPTLGDLYDYLRPWKNGHPLAADCLKKVRILGRNEDGRASTPNHALCAYLVFDTVLNGKRYVLTNQKWYQVDDRYLQNVENRIGKIAICHNPVVLDWPKLPRAGVMMHHEEDYNKLYSADPNFLVLDRKPFQQFGKNRGTSKVEFADLYHAPTKKLLCVKRWNGSATMSHLLAQGSVSADLLRSHPSYREELFAQVKRHWPNASHPRDALAFLDGMTFVYVIGTERSSPSCDMLPVFSKVHMLRHVRDIEARGFRVEVAWASVV